MDLVEETLMQHFHFDAADLKANKAGKVSDAQVERFMIEQRRSLTVAGAVISFMAALLIFIVSLQAISDESFDLATLLWVLLPLSLVDVGAILIVRYIQKQNLERLKSGRVRRRSGPLVIVPRSKRSLEHLAVGRIRFTLTPTQFAFLKEVLEADPQAQVAVYEVPQDARILSLELDVRYDG